MLFYFGICIWSILQPLALFQTKLNSTQTNHQMNTNNIILYDLIGRIILESGWTQSQTLLSW